MISSAASGIPIAIQWRRAPRSPAWAIVENRDRVYTLASASLDRGEQEVCPGAGVEKSRDATILPGKSYTPSSPEWQLAAPVIACNSA
jgi:hypothetical protein